MNTARVSGWVQGPPELRITKDGRRILNFEIAVDGPRAHEPYIPIGYILRGDETLDLKPGEKILAVGPLLHHRSRGLFVAAEEIMILGNERERNPGDDACASTANASGTSREIAVAEKSDA